MKKRILAILSAPDAIPPKPKIAAIIAIMIKMIVQRNIVFVLLISIEQMYFIHCEILEN